MGSHHRTNNRPVPSRRSSMSRPGDWNCSQCSNHNFAYRVECNKCKAPKDNATQELQPPPGQQAYNQQGGGQQGGYPNDWLCGSCGNDNFARRTECNKCQQPRDPNSKLVEPPSQQGGYGQQQGGYGQQQGGYGQQQQSYAPQAINCPNPGGYPEYPQYHENPIGDIPAPPAYGSQQGGYGTQQGGYGQQQQQGGYGQPQGGYSQPQGGYGQQQQQGGGYPNDWLCGSCGNDNFARRTECNKC